MALALVAIGAAIAVGGRAWDQFTADDVSFPNQPEQHFGSLSGANRDEFWRRRDRRLRRKAGARRRRRHLPVLLGAAALDLGAGAPTPTRSTWRPSPSSGWSAACSSSRWSGSLLWTGFAAWRAAPGAQRELYAALLAADARLRRRRRDRLVLGDRGARRDLLPRRRRPRRRPLRPARPGGQRRHERPRRRAAVRPRGGRAGDRLDHRAGPDRPAAGRPRDQSQPGSGRRGQHRRRRRTTPTRPARSSPGPPPLTCSSGCWPRLQGDYPAARERLSQAIEREDRNWVLYYLRSKVEHEAGDDAGARADLRRAQAAESSRELPAGRVGRLRMSRTSDAQRTARAPRRPADAGSRAARRRSAAGRLGLSGPDGSRRRGAMLRRLLACGDWAALLGSLCLVTATTSTTDVATLFWAVLFSPAWILVIKLHGLYDNDHRRIRHSTLDELSSLVSASVLGTLVLDGLLALSPVGPALPRQRDRGRPRRPRRQLRRARRPALPLAPPDRARRRDRDRPGRRRRHGRAARLHPPGDATGSWSATSRRATRPPRSCRGWARSPTSPGSPASTRSSEWS